MTNYSRLVDILIKDEMKGNPRHENVLILGETPQILVEHAGFPNLELAIKAKTISKACFDHGIKKSLLQRLPEIVDSPKSIFRSANAERQDSVVVVTFEIQNSYPVVIPIAMNKKTGRNSYYNLVSSVYGKEGADPHEKWKREGLLLWEDE